MKNMKFLTAQFKGRDEEKREITAFASTPRLDRDREIIRSDAWDLAGFKKHPVLAISHAYEKLWLGKITEITPTSDGLFFRAVFAKTAAAEEVWQLIKSTGMAAFSVGFLPIASENVPVRKLAPAEQKAALAAGLTLDGSVRVYSKVELLEISVVSVPSNTSATLLSWKGLAKTAELRRALEEITIEDSSEEITIEDESKESAEKLIDEYIAGGDFKRAVKEAVEVALAKVRGRVI